MACRRKRLTKRIACAATCRIDVASGATGSVEGRTQSVSSAFDFSEVFQAHPEKFMLLSGDSRQ